MTRAWVARCRRSVRAAVSCAGDLASLCASLEKLPSVHTLRLLRWGPPLIRPRASLLSLSLRKLPQAVPQVRGWVLGGGGWGRGRR